MAKKSKYREITDKYFQLNLKNKYIDLYHFSDYFNTFFLNTCQELEELKELVSSLDVHELISEEEYADAIERISFLEESAQAMARSLSNDSKKEDTKDSGHDNTNGEEESAPREEKHLSAFLIEKDDLGNWGVKGLPWKDLYVGKTITRDIHDKLYGCLWKLMEYEDTALSPEQIERMKDDILRWNNEKCPYFESNEYGDICHSGINEDCPNPFECSAIYDINGEPLCDDNSGLDIELLNL